MYRTGYPGDGRAEKPNRGLQGNLKISNNKGLVTTPKAEGREKKQCFQSPGAGGRGAPSVGSWCP